MPRPEAHDVFAGYLDEVAGLLAGAERSRVADVVDELRDGLIEAFYAETARGVPPAAAAQSAIRRSGAPEMVAAAHAGELAVRRSRRGALAVVLILLFCGLVWYLGYERVLGVPPSATPMHGWPRDVFLATSTVVQYLPLLAGLGAVVHLLASRRLHPGRWSRCGIVAGTAATLVVAALGGQLIAMATVLAVGGPDLWSPARTALSATLLAAQVWAFTMSVMLARELARACRS